nr:hypothetical protein [Solirubrobacterales bacterium]
TIILPAALARLRHAGARLEDGKLEVSFVDDRKIPADEPGAEPAAPAGQEGSTRRRSRQRA